MDLKKWHILSFFGLLLTLSANAHVNPLSNSPNSNTPVVNNGDVASFRNDCVKPNAQRDQSINNVRARLTTGGDVWWDRSDGKYIVPKPTQAGDVEVSSIFAGGVWLGGVQEGNIKVAAQTYGNGNANTRDFWTGPLNPSNDPILRGTTADSICSNWDRFWVVTAREIDEHIANYTDAVENGVDYNTALIPEGVKGWPGKGNEFFFELNNFELPNTDQGLGAFWDENGDGLYTPQFGDYPIVEIEGCGEAPNYPDEMFFWIYNDAGNVHTESNGDVIKMEIQVQSFAYQTNDALNDMTFQRYKLINRASAPIDSTFFAMWIDADLGCHTDDYIGCDTTRSLAYYYNVDPEDGTVGTVCDGGAPTYGTNIPALGIDYFRGPKKPIFDEFDNIIGEEELGMSSFTYFNNPGQGNPPGAETDPQTFDEFYNYLSGTWRDGSPFTFGGNGYGGTEPVKYVFPDPPNDPAGWSMCTAADANNPEYDRRTVQASGPFRLLPGAVNELIVGAVWVPDFDYPCPDLTRLFNADDLAQNLFDACFDILDGPDAPDVDIIELDKELVLILTNNAPSNNINLEYEERDIKAPEVEDSTYVFEGYLVYQLIDGFVTAAEYEDPSKARLIGQVDVKNGITEIYNWSSLDDVPDFVGENPIFVADKKVNGADEGIQNTFTVRNDQFASGFDTRLINQNTYYFSTVAYAYNNFDNFDPQLGEGQSTPFLPGRRNIKIYTAVPRPITDVKLNADFGDGVEITRLDGVGNGGQFLELTETTKEEIVNGDFDGGRYDAGLTYEAGAGPIDIQVYNPLGVKDGDFKLEVLSLENWALYNVRENDQVEIATSDKPIDVLNEQLIGDYGITIAVEQTVEPGAQLTNDNGAVGSDIEYLTENARPWYQGVPNGGGELIGEQQFLSQLLNFVGPEDIQSEDSDRGLTNIGNGFVPYRLTEYRTAPYAPVGNISPAWQNNSNNLVRVNQSLADLNNVDIVFTNDKSKWSRCVVVETAGPGTDVGIPAIGSADNFDLRQSPSVGKDADADGLPAADNTGTGMGWFPGYAIDVETGRRLNIFFGENSRYNCDNIDCSTLPAPLTGGDMMFNPSTQNFITTPGNPTAFNLMLGGQHFVYVTNQAYDGCNEIAGLLEGNSLNRVNALKNITWAGVPATTEAFNSYADGLVPSDVVVKLRVDNPYADQEGVSSEDGTNPTYLFSIDGQQPSELDDAGVESQLDMINVVPNPYYGFSDYEQNNTDNIVKITNLPAKCVVTIYSLDGKFIRQYNRDETAGAPTGSGIAKTQIMPFIDWDMKNSKNIPIAGGVYLIHVDAGELGERVLKWFGTNRQFDPSNL